MLSTDRRAPHVTLTFPRLTPSQPLLWVCVLFLLQKPADGLGVDGDRASGSGGPLGRRGVPDRASLPRRRRERCCCPSPRQQPCRPRLNDISATAPSQVKHLHAARPALNFWSFSLPSWAAAATSRTLSPLPTPSLTSGNPPKPKPVPFQRKRTQTRPIHCLVRANHSLFLSMGPHLRGSSGACMLDCVFDKTRDTFYVLDVLYWQGTNVESCETAFRCVHDPSRSVAWPGLPAPSSALIDALPAYLPALLERLAFSGCTLG